MGLAAKRSQIAARIKELRRYLLDAYDSQDDAATEEIMVEIDELVATDVFLQAMMNDTSRCKRSA